MPSVTATFKMKFLALASLAIAAPFGIDFNLPIPFGDLPIPLPDLDGPLPTLSLPQNASSADAGKREAELAANQKKFITVPWEFTITQNDGPSMQVVGPRSAKFNPSNILFDPITKLILSEAANVLVRDAPLSLSTKYGIINTMDNLPIKTLDDLTHIHEAFSKKIPVPNSINDWQTDKSFGQDRLTWGGYALKKESTDALKIPDDLATEITGSTIAELLKEGKLYAVDYTMMGKYTKNAVNVPNPMNQSVPSTYGQFYVSKDGSFLPLAIKIVESNLVYTPKDSAQDWMYAKLAFAVSETVFLPVEHFNVCHWNLLGMRTEMFRHLSSVHPVSALMQHHYEDAYGIVADGIQSLLQAGRTLDKTFGSGGKGAAFAVHDRDQTYDFSQQKYNNFFKIAGTEDLEGYKYRDDLKDTQSTIAAFVIEYLSSFYKSDADVVADSELQSWAAATADPKFGGMKGFPQKFDDLATLADTLADLITFVTTQHNIVNGYGTWDGQAFPAHPSAIYGSYPTKKGQVQNARDYIARTPKLIGLELGLHSLFRRPSLSSQLLGHSYHNYLGATAVGPIKNFQAKLDALSKKINAREAGSARPFLSADPAQVIYQAWI